MNDYEIGWIEAIVDGEGSIGITKQKMDNWRGCVYIPHLAITNTNLMLLIKAQKILGGPDVGKIRTVSRPQRLKNRRVCYKLKLYPNDCRDILPELSGLIDKRRQRELVLEFLDLYRKERSRDHNTAKETRIEEIYREVKKLNRSEY